jgi:hypothetical protein
MMATLYDIATATVVATLAGNELAVAAFVHPQLRKLNAGAHAQTAQPLANVLGKAMPFWYGAALVLIIGAIFEHHPITSGAGLLITFAAVLWAVIIAFTIALLVPINNRIAGMNPEQPYPTWLEDRCRWDKLHRVRVELVMIAMLLLFAGLFGGITTHVS